MDRPLTSLVALALALGALALPRARGDDLPHPAAAGEPVPWCADLDEARAHAARSRKPVVVGFAAAWCSACRELREETLPSREVQEVKDRFLWARVDVDRDLSTARAHGVVATPQLVVLDPDGRPRGRIVGALGPAELRRRLEELLAGMKARPDFDAAAPLPTVEAEGKTPLTLGEEGYRAQAICVSNVGYGPLRLGLQSPLQVLRLGLSPRTPSTLAEGAVEGRGAATWVNIWGQNEGEGFRVDYEQLQAGVGIGYGLTDTVELDLEYDLRSRFGGVMDGFIEGFHGLFGLSQGGRTNFPRDEVAVEVEERGARPRISLGDDEAGPFTSQLRLTLQHNVTCGDEVLPAFAYSLTAATDLGHSEDLKGGSPVDLGASVSVAKRFGDVYAYLGVGFAWYGNEEARGLRLRATQLSGLAAVEWRLFPRTSLLLQYLAGEGAAEDALGAFNAPSHELTLGVKTEVGWQTVLEVGLIENLVTFDNSPDFGVHAGLAHRF